jgi:hypothetical protein
VSSGVPAAAAHRFGEAGQTDRKSDAIAVFGARLLDVDTESGRHARVRRPDACPVVYYPDENVPDGATNYKRG